MPTLACVAEDPMAASAVSPPGSDDGSPADTAIASFVDGKGARWDFRRAVTAWAPAEAAPPSDTEPSDAAPTPQRSWDQLDDAEAIRLLRPITLTPDNREYTLDDEQTLRLVEQIRNARARVPAQQSMLQIATPESGTALSVLSRRVLSEDRFPTQTFDGDGRVNMNGSASESPWAYIASMAHAGQCTAFKMLNNYTAITAAHCVHDGSEWRPRKTLQFAAGSGEPRSELPADCYSITLASGWKGSESEYDFAVIRLREDDVASGASCDFDAYNVGHFGYQTVDECVVDVRLNLAGYPSERDPDHPAPTGDWKYPTLFTDYRADGWTACAGVYPDTLWFYNDGSNGQSGSPVWTFYEDSGQNKVRAIYRGSVSSIFGDSNRGRRMDAGLIAWLQSHAGS